MPDHQDKRKHKGKGRGQAKGKRGNGESTTSSDREVLKLMVSDAPECRSGVQGSTRHGFLLTLRNTEAPECLLPVMFRVSTAWRRAKETDPASLDRLLRCSLLISLILELHWLTPDLKWQYRVWNPAAGGGTGALEVDTSRTPLAQEAVLEHLAQAQKLALEASNLRGSKRLGHWPRT